MIHTDDIAWNHSRFGWTDLILDVVIAPLRRGVDVKFRPPAWDCHGRVGVIEVPADANLVVIEGVGTGRSELADCIDATLWVQSDLIQAQRRDAERIQRGEITDAQHDAWMAEEVPFLAEQRPWERANMIVAGSPVLTHDPRTSVVIAQLATLH